MCRGVWFPKTYTDSSYQCSFQYSINRCVSHLCPCLFCNHHTSKTVTNQYPLFHQTLLQLLNLFGVGEKELGRCLLSSKTGGANSTGRLGAVAPSSVGPRTSASLRFRRKVREDTPNELYQRNRTSTPNTVFY